MSNAVECWPVTHFIEEELLARKVPLRSFLNLVGMKKQRWDELHAGRKGLMISECERLSGALGVNIQFIVNLNMRYMDWKRDQE